MSDSSMDDADETTTLTEQAARWWVTLHGEAADPKVRGAFAEWTARSPQHVAAYLRLARAIRAVRHTDVQWPDTPVDTLVREAREAREARAEVVQFRPRSERDSRGRPFNREAVRTQRPWAFPALTAMVVLAVGTALVGWWVASADHYSTRLGEQRSVALEDGSIVTLNTSSEIAVSFTAAHRRVRLVEGEALFQVAHDPNRPFDVAAGAATVRAVGTEFNVDRRETRTTVTVVEGRVAVSSQRAAAGPAEGNSLLAATEQVVIDHGSVGIPEHVASVAPVLAWTKRQLIFNRRPIGEVAAEFNRYNHRQIEIQDAGLPAEPLTGVFQANDPQSFLTFLTHMHGVQIDSSGSGVVRVNLH